jgi:hypothetical protein
MCYDPAKKRGMMPDTIRGRDLTIYSLDRQTIHLAVKADVAFQSDGSSHDATVLKCDALGATLETTFKPPVGSTIRIGRVSGRVVAHLSTAIVVEFLDIDE